MENVPNSLTWVRSGAHRAVYDFDKQKDLKMDFETTEGHSCIDKAVEWIFSQEGERRGAQA